jgi:ribosomal protein L7/L12
MSVSDFEEAIRGLAENHPQVPLGHAVRHVDAILAGALPGTPPTTEASALALWAQENLPEVQTAVAQGQKVRAIVALRAATTASLKEAKDAIDVLLPRWS